MTTGSTRDVRCFAVVCVCEEVFRKKKKKERDSGVKIKAHQTLLALLQFLSCTQAEKRRINNNIKTELFFFLR